MAKLVGASSLYQNIVGLIPDQGTYLGYRFDPGLGVYRKATNQCFSLALIFLCLPSSLSERNKKISSGEDKKKWTFQPSQAFR